MAMRIRRQYIPARRLRAKNPTIFLPDQFDNRNFVNGRAENPTIKQSAYCLKRKSLQCQKKKDIQHLLTHQWLLDYLYDKRGLAENTIQQR